MIPSGCVELEELPVTGSGKVDRKALREQGGKAVQQGGEYIAPRTVTERILAEIWEELLSVDRAGIYDNFFELGGHSLLATRVVSAIRKALSVELRVRDLFLYPTIK